jgi:hypothetical protein
MNHDLSKELEELHILVSKILEHLQIYTLISCNKNVVYSGITQTLLLEAFSDLADELRSLF